MYLSLAVILLCHISACDEQKFLFLPQMYCAYGLDLIIVIVEALIRISYIMNLL